ncbi:ATP-binding protein [Kitasatospora sp. NPDC052896]|uniref:ATP-binding protein n=1 Tax=Kitasatospora sp. NPDC052896 TaxID=3364061 RepID=UPI0037C52EAF
MGTDHRHDVGLSKASTFSAVPGFVGLARRFAVDVAQSNGWRDDFTLGLVVSELATNAVEANAVLFTVIVFDPYEDESCRYLLVEVVDDCKTLPAKKQSMPLVVTGRVPPERGRGLPLVSTLSEEWHPEERDVGKAICVTLKEELHAPARGGNGCPSARFKPSVA